MLYIYIYSYISTDHEYRGDLAGEGGVNLEGVTEAPTLQVKDHLDPPLLGLRLHGDDL